MDEIVEVRIQAIRDRIIPTKRLIRAQPIEDARVLLRQRSQLPEAIVVKDVGSDKYLIAFGHAVIAGALLALEDAPALGDWPIFLREIVSPRVRINRRQYTRLEFSAFLFEKAKAAGYLLPNEDIDWNLFIDSARKLVGRMTDVLIEPAETVHELETLRDLADTPFTPPVPADEDEKREPAAEGEFVEGGSEVINRRLIERLWREKEQKNQNPADDSPDTP